VKQGRKLWTLSCKSALKRALAAPEGRSYLVDAWLLRGALAGEDARAGRASADTPRRPAQAPRSTTLRWVVAASLAASLTSGVMIGRMTVGLSSRQPAPPPVTATATVAPTPEPVFPVPAPTRVIQLEFHNAPGRTGGD
jgi:hypothetical protein